MGWSLGFDSKWNRDIGYGVPAYCDHPKCNKEIDRGLAYVCGSEPYGGEHGCGLYFCDEHHPHYKNGVMVCSRCNKNRNPYKPKPEHPDWIKHKMTNPSWEEWRKENKESAVPGAVAEQPTTAKSLQRSKQRSKHLAGRCRQCG